TSLLREGPNSRRIFSFRRFGTKTFLIFVIPVPPHSPSTMALNLPGRPTDGIRVRACRARARDRALDRRCGHGHAGTVAGRAALQGSCRARRLLRARGKPLRGAVAHHHPARRPERLLHAARQRLAAARRAAVLVDPRHDSGVADLHPDAVRAGATVSAPLVPAPRRTSAGIHLPAGAVAALVPA